MQLGDARAQQGFVKAVIKTSTTTNPLKLQSLASTKKYLPCYYFHHHYHDHYLLLLALHAVLAGSDLKR